MTSTPRPGRSWPLLSLAVIILASMTLAGPGCGCRGGAIQRPYAAPTAQSLLADLVAASDRARSYQIDSLIEYWGDGDRIKGTVLLMGERGAYVRIQTYFFTNNNPSDLACNGTGFKYIDTRNNCQLTGPCNRDSIAQLLRVSLHPDDFLLLVVGATPIIEYTDSSAAWDADDGHEVLTLTGRDGRETQTITLSGRHCDGRLPGLGGAGEGCPWEVVSSVVRDAEGNGLWDVSHKDFHTVRGVDDAVFRVPKKTLFKQPAENADLLIRWREHTLNPEIDHSKFELNIPAGLPRCGDNADAAAP